VKKRLLAILGMATSLSMGSGARGDAALISHCKDLDLQAIASAMTKRQQSFGTEAHIVIQPEAVFLFVAGQPISLSCVKTREFNGEALFVISGLETVTKIETVNEFNRHGALWGIATLLPSGKPTIHAALYLTGGVTSERVSDFITYSIAEAKNFKKRMEDAH
jgi:hypothetical protein